MIARLLTRQRRRRAERRCVAAYLRRIKEADDWRRWREYYQDTCAKIDWPHV